MSRVTIDSLWRCLCPSTDTIAVSRAASNLRGLSPTPVRPCSRARNKHISSRPIHSSVKLEAGVPWSTALGNDIPNLQKARPAIDTADVLQVADVYVPKTRSSKATIFSNLDEIPTTTLHDLLWKLRSQPGSSSRIRSVVKHLIGKRGEEPNLVHYDALIRANADPEQGSVTNVIELLEEMKEANIGPDSGLYHGVLQVLSNHPYSVLREEILRQMKQRWLSLTPEGRHSLVICLLRERNLEMAMEELEIMQQENITIQPWLYDIFIFQLCDGHEWDEALRLLSIRVERGEISTDAYIWHYLLDVFSAVLHYEGTNFIWQLKVATRHLNPCDGTCTNVLNVAARYSNPQLATSVLSLLSDRKSPLSTHQYEALIEAYVKSSDVKTAFRILIIMTKAGEVLSNATTRPIYHYLAKYAQRPKKAWEILKTMHKENNVIPTAAANVVIEAVAHFKDVNLAIDLYKQLHQLCLAGPNIDTFNTLLQPISRTGQNKDLAMFLAAEMRALRIKPNQLTYDRLIITCLGEKDYEDAFRYLDEMITVGDNVARADATESSEDPGGWWMRPGTTIKFLKLLDAAGDRRILDLLEEWDKRDSFSEMQYRASLKSRVYELFARQDEHDMEHSQQLDSVMH